MVRMLFVYTTMHIVLFLPETREIKWKDRDLVSSQVKAQRGHPVIIY